MIVRPSHKVNILLLLGITISFALCGCNLQNNQGPDSALTSVNVDDSLQVYQAEKNGLLLTVTLPRTILVGRDFTLTATILNQTEEDALYILPSSSEDMHLEIRVSIIANGIEFIDADIFGKAKNEELKLATLKVGEQFEETIRFVPGWQSGGSWQILDEAEISYFSPGIYQGTATFRWGGDPAYYYTTSNTLSVEFPVVII